MLNNILVTSSKNQQEKQGNKVNYFDKIILVPTIMSIMGIINPVWSDPATFISATVNQDSAEETMLKEQIEKILNKFSILSGPIAEIATGGDMGSALKETATDVSIVKTTGIVRSGVLLLALVVDLGPKKGCKERIEYPELDTNWKCVNYEDFINKFNNASMHDQISMLETNYRSFYHAYRSILSKYEGLMSNSGLNLKKMEINGKKIKNPDSYESELRKYKNYKKIFNHYYNQKKWYDELYNLIFNYKKNVGKTKRSRN